MTDPQVGAADCRRAAALVTHYGRGSVDGINAILREAVEAERISGLILAVLQLYDYLIPELRTPAAMQMMTSAILELAEKEGE